MSDNPTRITETERPTRAAEPAHLQREVWHQLKRHATATQKTREQAAQRFATERERVRTLVTDLARAHHQLTVFLAENAATFGATGLAEQAEFLATIRDRYGQVLTRAGADLLYLHEGQPVRLDLMDLIQITVSVPFEDVDQPRVLETVNPGVYLDAELVSKAEVRLAVPARPATAGDATHGGV